MSYTIAEAKEIMAETQRLIDKGALVGRRPKPSPPTVDARAAATKTPPSARELFFTELAEKMGEGLSKQDALRQLADEKPHLLAAFVAEENKGRQHEEHRKRETAARVRNRNN